MRRLSAPLVVAVALAALAVIAELATPDLWSELFIPLHLLSLALVIAASIMGILGISQLRSPWGTLAVAIATIGFATIVVSTVATNWYAMKLRELVLDPDNRAVFDLDVRPFAESCRWWSLVGSLGIVGSLAGIGLVSRRMVPLGAVIGAAILVGVLTGHFSATDFTLGDTLAAPIWQHASWLLGLAVLVWLAGAPSPTLASDGFRRAGQGLWIRALVLAIGFGLSLGGTPTDGDAHAFLHAITLGMFLITIAGFIVAAWGLVTASRLDEPKLARWLFASAAGLMLVAVGAWLTFLPAVNDERTISVHYSPSALAIVQGLALVLMMIALAAVVRSHGLHEIRNGAGLRIGVIVVAVAVVIGLRVPEGADLSPSVILREILMILVSVTAARECTNVAHRFTRVPEMPTAKLL